MTAQLNPELPRRLSRISRGCGVLAVAFGALVLTGWIFHIQIAKRIVPGQVAVKVNTALCFLLLGLVLWLWRADRRPSRVGTAIATLALVFVAVVGGISLIEYASGWNAGIDQLLLGEPPKDALGSVRPGLMSPITAIGFLLLGPALVLLHRKANAAINIAQILCAIVAIVSLFGVMDFVLDPRHSHTHISPVTASLLLILSFAIPASKPDRGVGALLASRSSGGMLIRRLLPASILIPVLLGWLRWRGASAGWYSEWAGVSLMTVGAAVLLASVSLWTAYIADKADHERVRVQENNSRLASIVNYSSEAIIGKTLDGTVISWNQAAEETYGYTAEEMVGSSIARIIPPERMDEFNQILERLRRGERIQHLESERVRKDGMRVQVSVAVAPIKDAAGHLLGASTVARDITEQKQAEQALQQSEERYRSLVTATAQIVWTTDADGTVVGDMPMWRAFTGMTVEQTKGWGWIDSLHPEDRERTAEIWKKAVSTRSLYETEYRIRRRDGEYRHVTVRGVPVLENDGSIREWIGICTDITDRKHAEQALEIERQRFRDVLDKLPVYVILLTPDYHVAMDNTVFRERFGESHGRRCYEYLFNRDKPCEICETYNVLKDGLPHQWKWTGPDGRHYDIFDFPFTDSDGSPLILEMGLDVTERDRAEAALHDSEAKFRALSDLVPQMVWMCTPDGLNNYFNQRWVEYTGLSLEESYGRGWNTPFHDEDKQAAWDAWNHAVSTGDTYRVESRLRAADGSYRWFLMRGVPVHDNTGNIVKWFGTCTDIHDLKQAQAELKQLNEELDERVRHRTAQLADSEQRVRRKLDSILAPEGDLANLELSDIVDISALQALLNDFGDVVRTTLGVVDLRGKVLAVAGWQKICMQFHRANPESCKNCTESDLVLSAGIPAGEFRIYKCKNNMCDVATPIMVGGQHMGNLYYGQFFFEDEPIDYEVFRAQARKYGFDEEEYLAALETVPRLSRAAVNAGMGFLAKLAQVISQLSYSSIKLARSSTQVTLANAELAASNRELEAFTYSVSHDLRAPLRHISGFSKILLEDHAAELSEDARQLLDRICDGTRRMGHLVDDLLNLGRVTRQELCLQVTGLNTVVRDVIASLHMECEGRQVDWNIGDLPYVECDLGLMGQVFQNLLSNALKFSRPRTKALIEIGYRSVDGAPVVFVRDNGVGFSMKYANKLFGVFQRLHRAEDFEGTGVGLATVQRIIQKHGGRIWAEAEVDKGATFYFTLGATERAPNTTALKPEDIHELA